MLCAYSNKKCRYFFPVILPLIDCGQQTVTEVRRGLLATIKPVLLEL